MIAQGPLHDSEVMQHIMEATGETNTMFPILGHAVMHPELPVRLGFQDSVAPLPEHAAMRVAHYAMEE